VVILNLENNDVLGQAFVDYFNGDRNAYIILHNYSGDQPISKEKINISSYFEDFKEADKNALDECYGKVLDVGAGPGTHSLALMKRGIDIYSIDSSLGAVEIMKKRGLKNVICSDIRDYKAQKFDTLIFLGNSIGLFGDVNEMEKFLRTIDELLMPDGQILIPTHFIKLPFVKYIELSIEIEYKKITSERFKWFTIEPELLKNNFEKYNWNIKLTHFLNDKTCLIKMKRN
jgi:2-polyprenyl-3-methyl-5-hydroxy-6-metoxy-1,4-benzoquinol methylase